MAVNSLYYVTCDRCGNPAGTGEDLADSIAEARQTARNLGWITNVSKMTDDLCRACQVTDDDLPLLSTCRHGYPEGNCPACAACAACTGDCGTCPYVPGPR